MVKKGFSLVELLIVIIIIAVLASLATFSYLAVQRQSRDSQRDTSTAALVEGLEKYFEANGEYPSCAMLTSSPHTTLPGLDADAITMPLNSNTNAIVCSDITVSEQNDVIAFVGDGTTQCRTGNFCTSWTIKYKREGDGQLALIQSRHR